MAKLVSFSLILPLALTSFVACAEEEEQIPPNVIFILVDDQGWTDTGTRMDARIEGSVSDFYETPNIDRLAAESFRFTDGYAPSPICTPSRASILTGKSPQKLGFTEILESRPGSRRFSDLYAGKPLIGPLRVDGLSDTEATYAEVIRSQVDEDYALAHFGKWHVGGGGPAEHGFEAHDGSTGNHNVNAHSEDPNPKDVFGVTGRAISYMKTQLYSGRPFVIQLSHYANHVPLSAMHATVEKYESKVAGNRHSNALYAALNEDLDTSIGRLLDALESLGVRDNTYIIYTSDNGGSKNLKFPSTNNEPLREGKTWLYEGGIRVPLMISGPGIEPGESSVPVIGWDILPTICEMLQCEGDLPPGVEGGSLLPIASATADGVARPGGDALIWHFPHYLTAKGTTPQSAIRVGNLKLIKFHEDSDTELFDLDSDIGESANLSSNSPDQVSMLVSQLDDYLSESGARMPVPNTWTGISEEVIEVADPDIVGVALEGRHRSVFSRIRYRIPKGWVVVDGETDWLAPSNSKQFWNSSFESAEDSYFAVSSLPPYLSFEDRREKRNRTLEEFASATAHSLVVAADMEVSQPLQRFRLNGNDAISILAHQHETHSHYQVFVQIAENEIATVAANGPNSDLEANEALVNAIAATVRSGTQ